MVKREGDRNGKERGRQKTKHTDLDEPRNGKEITISVTRWIQTLKIGVPIMKMKQERWKTRMRDWKKP